MGIGPLALDDRTSVLALDPPRRLVLRVRARPLLLAHVTFDVEPTPDGQALLRLTEEPQRPWSVVTPLVAPMLKARNDRSLQQLHDAVTAAS